jgi:hypothetical protein
MPDVIGYPPLTERHHHHDHQIVDRGLAVADAEALTVADAEVNRSS